MSIELLDLALHIDRLEKEVQKNHDQLAMLYERIDRIEDNKQGGCSR